MIIVDAMSAQFCLKSKERSSEVLTGQTGAISLTATKSDARSAQRKQGLDFADRYVVAKCCHYMYSTVVLAESVAVRIEKSFSTK